MSRFVMESFKADEDLIVELDLTDEDVYQRVVKSVTINFKKSLC